MMAPGTSVTQLSGGNSAKVFSKALRDTEADRKHAAKQAKWDTDDSGDIDEEEAYIAEVALLERQKAMMDIILLIRDKIRMFSGSAYATRELKKVFRKFDPDGDGAISWFEFDKALQEMGVQVTVQEMEHLMEMFDAGGDGHIEWNEFIAWCDDRIPLNMEKMRRIITAHEGNKKMASDKPAVSKGYMKKWLEVHKNSVDMDIKAVTAGPTASSMVGNVKLLGDGSKVTAALSNRKRTRKDVVDSLRAKVISKSAANISMKDQLDQVWTKFDANGDGIINWKEFVQGMSNMGIEFTPADLSAIMKEFDTNCDGAIDYVEFVGHLLPTETTDLSDTFERCTMARRAMLQTRGIERAGTAIGVKPKTPFSH